MCDKSDLDEVYLDVPAADLLNDAEAALVEQFRGGMRDRLRSAIAAEVSRGSGIAKPREDRVRDAVEGLLHELYAADAKVAAGGAAGEVTVDLIEVDVRPELVAAALVADGCDRDAPN